TVKFGNDHVAKIIGYGDYKIGNVTISRVYFVEGLGYNLFSVGQFCDSDLEVAFRQHTCFIRNLESVDLLTGSRGNNLYTLSLGDMMTSSPISRQGHVRGLPKLKFEKDHLCYACAMGKRKKKSHKPKSEDTNQEKLYLLHMDLCGPMNDESVNEKKYILVIVDDYSRFTWVKCLRSKDEAPDFIIKFIKMIQVQLKVGISHDTSVARSPQQNGVMERCNRIVIKAARTMSKDETSDILKKFITERENLKDLKVKIIKCDNEGEYRNKEMNDFCSQKRIKREFSNARTPQQNGIAKKRNRTLIEAARTMLADAKLSVTFWAEAVNTAYETETPKKPPVKYAEQYRKPNKKPNVRGNQRNWNNLKSQQLGPDFVMKKKACFNCGDFNHLAYDCRKRMKKSFTPKPIAYRPYRPPVRPVRTNMNGARSNRTSFNKQAHSYANRPFHRTLAVRSHYRAPWVPTVSRNFPPVNRKFSTGSRNFPTANRKFPTASRKFPAGSTKCSTADMGIKGKAVKPSACWFWKPSQNLSNKGNISYLSDYEPFDGGYV
nr:hypothetical protein [Tanacetum cinerariifolium]